MSNALLVNYEYCFGCHSCELACKRFHGYPVGTYGIKLDEIGPYKNEQGRWVWEYVPQVTEYCDLCEERVAQGRKPTCVQHCLAFCLEYGTIEEMAKRAEEIGSKCQVLIP